MLQIQVVLVVFYAACVLAGGYPQRAIMLGGYYGKQPSMTAFASGETAATNSFSSSRYPNDPRRPEGVAPVHEEGDDENKAKPLATPGGGEDDEKNDPWPFGIKGRSYAFFPIIFGGGGESGGNDGGEEGPRKRNGGYHPGSPVAIANSFSTGRGGVATSHATSYGDPITATLLRNLYAKAGPRQE